MAEILARSWSGDCQYYKYDPDQSLFQTLRQFVGCRGDGTRKMPEGAFSMFTYELRQPVILLVNTTEHILGDVTHSRKIQKNSNMLDIWLGRWGASQIAVGHLYLTTCLFLVPDWARRWEFVSHDQTVE